MDHQQYVDAIKSSAVSLGRDAVLKYIFLKFPLLAWGPVGPLVSFIVEKIVAVLITKTEFALFFKYIDMRTDSQGRAFSEAAMNNHKVQISGTPEEKAQSEKILKDKFKAFVVLGG